MLKLRVRSLEQNAKNLSAALFRASKGPLHFRWCWFRASLGELRQELGLAWRCVRGWLIGFEWFRIWMWIL